WGLNQSWISYYSVAIAANNAIMELEEFEKNIPSGNVEQPKLNTQYKAEVRFLRAYAHLLPPRIFADVPILSDSRDIARLTTIGKSTMQQVGEFMIAEMDECAVALEDARATQSEHTGAVRKCSALLLKAIAAAELAKNDNCSR